MSLNPRIVGRSETPPGEAKCIHCKQPFKGGNKGEPGVNVYSKDGMKEIAISGVCETCFDGLFDLPDEDDLPEHDGSAPTLEDAYAEGRKDQCEETMELLRWAYSKLHHVSFTKQDDALNLDRIKLILEHGVCA